MGDKGDWIPAFAGMTMGGCYGEWGGRLRLDDTRITLPTTLPQSLPKREGGQKPSLTKGQFRIGKVDANLSLNISA